MIRIANSGYGVNFNQLAGITTPKTVGGITCTHLSDGGYRFTGTANSSGAIFTWNTIDNIIPIPTHKYYIKFLVTDYEADSTLPKFVANGIGSLNSPYERIITAAGNANQTLYSYWNANARSDCTVYVIQSDLTVMFGAGNEPTVEEFRSMYPDDYYDYVSSQWQWSKNNYVTAYPTPCFGVDFNQLLQNSNFSGTTNWGARWYPTTLSTLNNVLTATAGTQYPNLVNLSQTVRDYIVGHKYLAFAEIRNNDTDTNRASFAFGDTFPNYQTITSSFSYIYQLYTVSTSLVHVFGIMGAGTDSSVQSSIQVKHIGLFDLTQMYGAGYEPATVEEFRAKYSADYYAYTLSRMEYINQTTAYTLLPIENHVVGIIKPELSNISLIQLKSGSYKNTADNGPYVTVSDGNEITINTPSTDATYGLTNVPFISAFVSANTLKAGHTYYWFIDGEKRSGDWNAIVMYYSDKHLDAYFLYAGNINTFTPETDVTITLVRVYLSNSSKHYDNYKIKLIITENQQYLIDKGLISQ